MACVNHLIPMQEVVEIHQYLINLTNGVDFFKLTSEQKSKADSNILKANNAGLLTTTLRRQFELIEDILCGQVKVIWERLQLPITGPLMEENSSIVKHSLLFNSCQQEIRMETATIDAAGAQTQVIDSSNVRNVNDGAVATLAGNSAPEFPIDLSQSQRKTPFPVQSESGRENEELKKENTMLQKKLEEKDEIIRFKDELRRSTQGLPYSPVESTALLKAIVSVAKHYKRYCTLEQIATNARSLKFWGGEETSVKRKYDNYIKQINGKPIFRSSISLKTKWGSIMDKIAVHELLVFVKNDFCDIELLEDQQILVELAKECVGMKIKRQPAILRSSSIEKKEPTTWDPFNLD